MKVEINKLVSDKIDLKFLEKFAQKVLKLMKLNVVNLSIAIVDDAKMKALNKKYRKKNKTTDVLSFDYGEIIICLNQAKRQAKKEKHSLEQELEMLLLHGILHLAGYDDQTKKDYNKMIIRQGGIWREIKL
ncbi:MAG: rRNA maturation RNase YbeY [Patescibacteria group bacterium]